MNAVERVKSICKERKIAISKLEVDCGFSNAYISQLRKGTFPNDRLEIISKYLGVSVDYLMTGKEPSDSKYDSEMASLVGKLRKDKEMLEALIKYFDSSIEIKKHIVSTINMLCDSSK